MIRFLSCLLFAGMVAAGPLLAAEPYDLIFRTGTLSDVPHDQELVYTREVNARDNPQMGASNTGRIVLSFVPDDMAELDFQQKEGHRTVGRFPTSVGNPLIMYFVETVIRDMSQNAGGSPYYIRNRIKESLVAAAEIKVIEVDLDGQSVKAQQVTLRPFEGDENTERMKGYDALALTVTVSDEVPGWYASLEARVPDTGSGTPLYRSALTFAAAERAE